MKDDVKSTMSPGYPVNRLGKSEMQRVLLAQHLKRHPDATVMYVSRDNVRIEKPVPQEYYDLNKDPK